MAKTDFFKALLDKGYTKDAQGNFVPPNRLKTSENKPVIKSTTYSSGSVTISNSNILMVFDIEPIGKPRMTRSDKWKTDPFHPDPKKRQRKPVTMYFRFKSALISQCLEKGFKMPEDDFHLIFILPMPHSWSDKKKHQMDGARHKQKPDTDNMVKAVQDCLLSEDKYVSDIRGTKFWGRTGKIIVMNMQPFGINDVKL